MVQRPRPTCAVGSSNLSAFRHWIWGGAYFEVVTPRFPLPDFVPSRIWLPYGVWKLSDGSEVLFSRDYLPMWRVSSERTERLAPRLWIMASSLKRISPVLEPPVGLWSGARKGTRLPAAASYFRAAEADRYHAAPLRAPDRFSAGRCCTPLMPPNAIPTSRLTPGSTPVFLV